MSVNPTGIGLYSLDEGIQSTVHDASGSAFDIRVYDDIGVVMRSTPQVLIIDLLQSGAEGGYTLCKRIRQEVTWVDIPLFAITRDTSRSVSLALTAGFDDCLFLPMNQILFKHRMRQALKQYDVNRSARRYRSFVSHTQDAMIVVNPGEYGGDIKVWNAAAEQIYGWSADETVSQSLHEFIPTTYLTDQAEAQARQQIIDEHFWKGEVVQPHKDKTSLRIHASVSAVTDDTGQIIEYVGLNRDITVIHESEVALKQSEERLSSILAAIPELVLVLDREGIYRWIATEQHPILLLPAEKLLNHRLDEFFDKKQVDMFLSCIHQVLDTGTTVEMEYTLNLKGHLRWLQATVVKLDAERVVWVAYDISERKASEKALQESANSYRHLFESANDAIFLVDVQTGQISEANRQACRLLGYTIDELIGMAIEDVEVSTDDNYNDTLTATMGNTNRLIFEQQYRRKDGKIITVESSSRITRYLGKMGILSFARDITVRKRAEAAEHEQRLLAEALRDTAAAFNSTLEHDEVLDLILEYVNHVVMSEASEIMLIDEGYVTIRRHRGYIAPDVTLDDLKQLRFRADLTQNMKWMIEHQQSLYIPDIAAYEGWVSQREAEWIQSMLSAPIIIKGEVTGFINLLSSEPGAFDRTHFDRLQAFANQAAIAIHNAALFESTQQFAIEKEREVMQRTAALEDANQSLKEQMLERRQIEEALEDERNLLRTLIDNLPDHIYVKDWQSRFILANQALVEFLGLPHLDALLGKTDIDLGMPENAVELYEQEQTIVLSGDLLLNVEAIRESATGNTTWLLTSKMPLRDVGGDIIGLVGINRDITAIRLAEESLENERNLLRTLIDTIPDLIYIKDRESRFLLANQATMDLLGASQIEDVVGRTDFDFFPENEASQFFRIENSIMMDDIPVINSQRDHIDQNGTLSSMLVSKFPLMDTDKNVIGLIGVQRDISELRQAQDYLMRVLESARCLLWYATVEDNGGTYVWDLHIANEEAAAAFLPVAQESDDYTVGWLASIFPEDHIKRQRMLETNLKYNRSYSLELRCLQLDQSVRWLVEDVQIKSATPGRWNLVGICTDITERKTAEKKLQSAHDTLELRVGERTRELLRTNETLQQEINERRRAEDAERKQRILAEALRDSSVAINQHIEIGTALDELLGTLTSVVPHDGSMITLLNEDVLRIVGRYGQTINMGNIEISISTMSNLQQILATRESLAIDDVTRYEGWITLAGEEWIRANLVIPIVLDDEIVGFLHLNSRYPGRFTRQDVTHLEGFASQVSIAIRNERLMDEIHQHAADLEVRVDARTADLTQKTAELEAILNAMRDGVVYYDLDAVPQYINWAMSDITQFSNEMWLSGQAEQAMLYIPPDDEDEDIVLVEHPRETILDRRGKLMLERQGFWQRDMLLQREDGSLFDAGVTWAEVRDDTNARIGMVMVLRDISEPKQLEKQKKQFIASASHELRTPITNMKTRLYLMRRQPERFDEHIEVAESVVNWMSHLVETMFDISRFEQGVIVLQHEQFVLQDLLMDVYNDHFPAASNAHVDLSYVMPEDAIDYIADRSRMRQVLTNLVSNALYYTSENGFVRIELVHDESNIYIRVIDNGAGIPEESQARLFEPFYRAHDNNKGAGLGLSIANDIVTRHGGHMSVESMVDEGSTFIIQLPVKQREINPIN